MCFLKDPSVICRHVPNGKTVDDHLSHVDGERIVVGWSLVGQLIVRQVICRLETFRLQLFHHFPTAKEEHLALFYRKGRTFSAFLQKRKNIYRYYTEKKEYLALSTEKEKHLALFYRKGRTYSDVICILSVQYSEVKVK